MRPWPLLLVFATACASDSGAADDDDDSSADSVLGPDEVIMDDTSAGLTVEVVGGTATGWLFGAFEPRVDLYEEACRDADDICHTLGPGGGTIAWAHDCNSNGDGSTCIAQLYWRQGQMSFVIKPELGVGCWAWGDDADYYDGCTITDWEPDSY